VTYQRPHHRGLTEAQRKRLEAWSAERLLWARQAGEPEQAYAAFLILRDTPVPRPTLADVHAASKVRAKLSTWKVWCSKWMWYPRLEAWDLHMQVPVHDALIARHVVNADEVADRQIEHARKLHALATHELDKLLQISRDEDGPVLGVRTLMQLITLALDLEKQLIPIDAERPGQAHGQPGRINFSHLDTADLQRLREIAVKCRLGSGD
jgi:hypothetical protein